MRGLPKTGRGRFGLALLLVVAGFVTAGLLGGVANAGACQGGATKNWSGLAINDSWHEPSNWLPVGVPGATDHVCISLATSTVLYTAGTTDILSLDAEDPLNMSGGTLNLTDVTTDSEATNLGLFGATLGGAGELIVQPGGSMIWSGGIMTNAGTTTISSTAALSIQGPGAKTINGGRTLDNQGTTNWIGTGIIQHGTGALMANSGTFNVGGDADMIHNQGGTRLHITVTPTGVLEKTVGSSNAIVDAAVENDGVVEASAGSLWLQGGTDETTPTDVSGGDFLATGGVLDFTGGVHRIAGAGSSVTSDLAGEVIFSGGGPSTINPGTYDVNGSTGVLGGDFNFDTVGATTEGFTLSGGTLGGTGTLTVGETGNWNGGVMNDPGTTVIDSTATLSISTSAAKTISGGRTLVNQGTTFWVDGNIQHGTGALMTNSGTFDIQTDADMTHNQGGTRLHITNTPTGIFEKTAGGNITIVDAALENDGSVNVSIVALRLSGGTDETNPADTSGGDFSATGANLDFGGGIHRISGPGSSVTSDASGTVHFSGGGATINPATYAVTGHTVVTAGDFDFNTVGATTEDLTLFGGILGGTGDLTVLDAGFWSGGIMTDAGTTRIDPLASFNIQGTTAKTINSSRTLDNQGSTFWTGTGIIQHGTGALMTNSGTFDIQTDADMVHNQGGTRLHITNLGTGLFEKTAGATNTIIDAALENDGTTDVSSGSLQLTGGTDETTPADVSGGDFTATGALLDFAGGAHRISGAGSSVTSNGTGTVAFGGGSTVVNPASYDVDGTTMVTGADTDFNTVGATTQTLFLSAGSLGGTGDLTVLGNGFWVGGTMTDVGTTRIDSVAGILSIEGSGPKTINGGHTLDNQGITNWTGTGTIQHGTGALMTNSGTLNIQSDADMTHNQGGTRLHITNTGTGVLEKTAGAGSSDIDAAVENDGLTEVASGTLRLVGGTDETTPADVSGGAFAATGALLDFGGGSHRISGAGSSVTSVTSGTVAFSGGTTNVGADTAYTVAGTTLVSGGTVNFNTLPASGPTTTHLTLSSGTLGGTGELAVQQTGSWTGGSMSDAGTTIFQGTLDISGSAGKTINSSHTLDNQGTTTWTGTGDLNTGNGAVIDNSGTFIIQNDETMIHNQGGTRLLFNNTGALARTTGVGTAELQATVDNTPAGGGEGSIDVGSGTLFLNGTGSLANYNATTDTLTGGQYVVASATFKFTDADIDVNAADILLDGATSAIVDAANVDALGDFADNQDVFAILNGRDLTSTVPVSNSGIMTISNGTFTATGDYTQTDGETFIEAAPNSELVATGGCVDIQGGVLKGKGTAGPCVDVAGGSVQPGFSPGILNVDGTYAQSAGTLDIEVGGTTPGTQHDQLVVTGAATLGGTLALDTIGSPPADGDSFVVMTFASRTGTFASETWADLDPSLDFTVTYNPTNVTVNVGEAGGGTATADLRVVKTDAGREPKPLGRGFRYGIKVINLGPDEATEVMLVDTLPDEVEFISYRSGQGTCIEDSGVVTCDLGSITSGTFVKISIQVRTTGSGTATNTVTVSAAESDPVLGNNTDSEDTSIAAAP